MVVENNPRYKIINTTIRNKNITQFFKDMTRPSVYICFLYVLSKIEIRLRRVTDYLRIHFPSVEIPVAAAGSTCKSSTGTLSTGHELPAAIHSISTHVGCMIFLALPVAHAPVGRGRGIGTSVWSFSSHNYLPLLHALKTLILLLMCRFLQNLQTQEGFLLALP